MRKKSKALKRAEEYSIGDEFQERWMSDETVSVGHVVALYPFRQKIYFLISNEMHQYTIYSVQIGCICAPSLARFIPENAVRHLYAEAFMDVENPPRKRVPVLKKT